MYDKKECIFIILYENCIRSHLSVQDIPILGGYKKRPLISEWSCNSVRYWIRIRIRTEHEFLRPDHCCLSSDQKQRTA
jgi:hypothetical protein